MSKVSEIINTLQKLQESNGDVDCNIYISTNDVTRPINTDDIAFDDTEKDIYIGVY